MATLEKIILDNFSGGGKCNLFHYGIVQDCLPKNKFEFLSGNFYGIIGEFGTGGAALSCILTGNTQFYGGQIYVDDKESSIDYIIRNSWYVGLDTNKKKCKLRRKKTIRECIESGVRETAQECDAQMIGNLFNVSKERVERNIRYASGERWKASAAIGYAYGKKIFCYPWMNSKDVELLRQQLSETIKILIDCECIIIFPTTTENNLKMISNNYEKIMLS